MAAERIDTVSDELLDTYLAIGEEAYAGAAAAVDTSSPEREEQARDCLDIARRYLDDAKHFRGQGHYLNAFGALNYAHGWLDAGARLRLFRVTDSRLFTVDEE